MTSMTVHMRPMRLSLRVFGLSHSFPSDHLEESPTRKCLSMASKIYSIFVCFVMFLNVVRYVPSFWVGFDFVPNMTGTRIIAMLWYLQCAITFLIIHVFFDKKGNFHSYRTKYDEFISDSTAKRLNLDPCCKTVGRRMFIYLTAGWIFVFLNSVAVSFMTMTNTSLYAVAACNPFPYNSTVVKLIFCLVQVYCSGVWILPAVLHYSLSTALDIQFCNLCSALQKCVETQCYNQFEIIQDIRRKHQQLCHLLTVLDTNMKYYIANVYAVGIGDSCFISYELVNSKDMDIVQIISYCFWLFSIFAIISIISIKSAMVHEQAHSPLSILHTINISGASIEDISNINLFVAKLSGPPIGLSVMGIITITKEMLLTLGGLYVTYFFLLFQFSI